MNTFNPKWNTVNPKWKRYERWLIQRSVRSLRLDGFGRHAVYAWKATGPLDPCSDYVETRWFDTQIEAIEYANMQWMREHLKQEFADWLDNDTNLEELRNTLNQMGLYYSALLRLT